MSAETEDQILRRDLLVVVAELQEKRLGRAQDAEKVYAQILKAEPLHAGAFRALSRLYRDGQRWAELRALLDTRQLAELDVRERLDLLAADRGARRVGAGRPGPRARRLREDAGARRGRSARPPRAGSPLRRARALARPREPARHAGRLRLRRRGAGAGVPARRAARQPPRRRASARWTCWSRSSRSAPNHEGARRLLEKLVAMPAAAAARREDPRAGLRGERRLGAPGRRSSTSSARLLDGPDGGGAAGAHRRPAGEQAAGARRGAGDLAAGAGGRPGQPGRAGRDRAARHGAGALLRAGRRLPGAGVQEATRPTSRAAPTCCRGRRKLYAGRLGNRRAAIDVWKLVLDLDPERHRDRRRRPRPRWRRCTPRRATSPAW